MHRNVSLGRRRKKKEKNGDAREAVVGVQWFALACCGLVPSLPKVKSLLTTRPLEIIVWV